MSQRRDDDEGDNDMNRIIETIDPANRLDGDDSLLIEALTAHTEKFASVWGEKWQPARSFKNRRTLERKLAEAGISDLRSIIETDKGRFAAVVWQVGGLDRGSSYAGLVAIVSVR